MLKHPLRWLISTLVGVYILLFLGACALQDEMVYFPDRSPAVIPDGWPIDPVEIETPDGETLLAWHMTPSEGCPVMLMFHGNGGHIGRPFGVYEKIEGAGAGMLAVSWRGYTGSTGQPSEAGLYMDAQAAYDALRERGVPSGAIVVHGFSLGSGPAVKLAAENDVAALVLEAPYLSALKLAEESVPFLPVSWIFRHPYRSDLFVGDVRAPILMAHGTADRVIPARHSRDLLALAPEGAERVVFQGGRHNTLAAGGLYEDAIWPFLSPKFPNCSFTDSNEATPP